MAYVNVAEWTPEQVCDWIRGLEDCLSYYLEGFLVCKVNGRKLLQLAPDLLTSLGIYKIGHQELLLQAIQQLRNIHYHLDQETLQNLALRLSSKARSIYNELKQCVPSSLNGGGGSAGEDDGNSTDEDDHTVSAEKSGGGSSSSGSKRAKLVSTAVVAGVADCLSSVKTIVSWLNRSPFEGVETYDQLKSELVEMSIKLATIGQRDLFAEDQATVIRDNCLTLSQMADNIIQNSRDPLIIQPASLDVATIKKKPDDDLGVHLSSSYDGVHQVSLIRPLSPAHSCGKLSEGDHLIQVNYQTVIGWLPEKVTTMMYENPIEVILTVKKQPRHAPGATQIYFKPFRLPSKKRSYNHGYSSTNDYSYRNNFANLNLYSLLEGSPLQGSKTGSRQVSTTLPKPSPAKDDQNTSQKPNITAVKASHSDSPDKHHPALKRMASPSVFGEGRSSVSFAVSDEDSSGSHSITAATNTSPDNTSTSSGGCFITATIDSTTSTVTPPLLPVLHLQEPSAIPQSSTPLPEVSPLAQQRVSTPTGSGSRINTSNLNSSLLPSDDDDDDDAFLSSSDDTGVDNDDDAASTSASVRLYPPKPRAPVHRRATIPGDSAPAITGSTSLNQYIEVLRQSGIGARSASRSGASNTSQSSVDRSQDYSLHMRSYNADGKARPHTTIGPAKFNAGDSKDKTSASAVIEPQSLPSVVNGDTPPSLPPRTPSRQRLLVNSNSPAGPNSCSPSGNTMMIPQSVPLTITSPPTPLTPQPPSTPHTPSSGLISGRRVSEDRPKLDKSHSTPAYDFGADGPPNAGPVNNAPAQTVFFANVPPRVDLLPPDTEVNKKVRLTLDVPIASGNDVGKNFSSTESTPIVAVSSVATTPGEDDQLSTPRKHLPGVCGGGRRVPCRELGAGDHQGWLYRRSRNASTFLHTHTWDKRWFILKKGYLYGYSNHDASKAESLTYLPGFHVCPAQDAKTKKFAFKIYHANGATFYFACDSGEERSRWMSEMGLSALSSGRCSDSGGSPSPPLPHRHEEEAYYSETDEELETSDSVKQSSGPATAPVLTKSEAKETSTGGGLSSLFHWGSTGSQSSNNKSSNTTSTATSTRSTLSSIVSSKAAAASSGIKFLQPKTVQAVPSTNFRSYRRIRETGRSTSSTDLHEATSTGAAGTAPCKATAPVTRKGSLREKLRNHLPSALTLDRRKKNTQSHEYKNRKNITESESKEAVITVHSLPLTTEEDLDGEVESATAAALENITNAAEQKTDDVADTIAIIEEAVVATAPDTSMPLTTASTAKTKSSSESEKRMSGGSADSSSCTPITPLKCKLINTPHRGSLDCLSSSSSSQSSYGYKSEASHKSWMCTLRSSNTDGVPRRRPSPLPRAGGNTCSSSPNTPKTPAGNDSGCYFGSSLHSSISLNKSLSGTFSNVSGDSSMERLKRAGNYRPVTLKSTPNRDQSMRTAFVLGFDHQSQQSSNKFSSSGVTKSASFLNNTNNSSLSTNGGGTYRPQVPPRTKFLSPSERNLHQQTSSSTAAVITSCLSVSSSSLLTTAGNWQEGSSSSKGVGSSCVSAARAGLSNLCMTNADDHDQPKTPMKWSAEPFSSTTASATLNPFNKVRPTMGVSMIGKQRRTPGVLSPREVFFCSPPPSPSPITPHHPNQHLYHPNTTLATTTTPTSHPQHSTPSNARTFSSSSVLKAPPPADVNTTPLNAPPVTSPSNRGFPAFTSLSLAAQGTAGYDGRGRPMQVLPHYPNMEYPPIFEAGSYTISSNSNSLQDTSVFSPPHNLSNSAATPAHSTSTPTFAPTFSPCPNEASSASLGATNMSPLNGSSTHHSMDSSSLRPRPPIPNPRTPSHENRSLYYNLQGFSSASLPALSTGGSLSTINGQRQPDSYSGRKSSSPLSVNTSSVDALAPSSYGRDSNSISPRSAGVVVGISCTGATTVVSHHHSIYVTSPVKRPQLPLPSTGHSVGAREHSSSPSGHTLSHHTSADSILLNRVGCTPTAPLKDKPPTGRTARSSPPTTQASHSSSSLDSISEQQVNGTPPQHTRSSGGSVLSCLPMSLVVASNDGGPAGVIESFHQHGGSSGGTVITSIQGALPPPKLILPPPPSEPPPSTPPH